jgi:hypothetical protein
MLQQAMACLLWKDCPLNTGAESRYKQHAKGCKQHAKMQATCKDASKMQKDARCNMLKDATYKRTQDASNLQKDAG